ncbi:hypothetical protein Tco_0937846 [Tanacetum coccineum]|uniref:Reverse transcriptase domain-containing protein n=1 Tax=Tanacetum coccineum TaxID=301880 RepID=A0ABQ5DI78_9ASTR
MMLFQKRLLCLDIMSYVHSLPLKSPVYHEPSVASVVSASVVDRSIGIDNPHLSLGSQDDLWCIEHLKYYFLGCLAEHPTFMGHSNLLIKYEYVLKEPVEIMDREVKQLKQSRIPIIKVRWNSHRGPEFTWGGPEFTWEREDFFRSKYPHLFSNKKKTSMRNRASGRRSRKEGRM